MPTYEVTHEDGRTTRVIASDESTVKKQANHQETTRCIIAGRRGVPSRPDASLAVSVVKVKD